MIGKLTKMMAYKKAPKATYMLRHPVKGTKQMVAAKGLKGLVTGRTGAMLGTLAAIPVGIWAARKPAKSRCPSGRRLFLYLPAAESGCGPGARGGVVIEVDGLTKSYREASGERVVFRGLSMEARDGEIVVLLGPSGSGKTTLLNLISGIDVPTAGDVRIDGTSLPSLSERARTLVRRDHIGFVFQFFNLIPTLTVEENLLLPLELSGRDTAEDHARARGLLERVGLGDRAGVYPDRLSGGEQQRVAVARALAHDPAVVLADEPTGNLDRETGRTVLDLLESLARSAGKTVLIVTHSEEAVPLADRVLVLRDGAIRPR